MSDSSSLGAPGAGLQHASAGLLGLVAPCHNGVCVAVTPRER